MTSPKSIQTAEDAFLYARDVIKGRFPEGEAIIATDPRYAYCYSRDVICGRFENGESIIIIVPKYAYYYARDVVNGRWLDGELQILFSKYVTDYARLCGMTFD